MGRYGDLESSLTNHTPNAETVVIIESIRSYGKSLGYNIITNLPESREKSIALTKLEECVMWAVKSAVLHQEAE